MPVEVMRHPEFGVFLKHSEQAESVIVGTDVTDDGLNTLYPAITVIYPEQFTADISIIIKAMDAAGVMPMVQFYQPDKGRDMPKGVLIIFMFKPVNFETLRALFSAEELKGLGQVLLEDNLGLLTSAEYTFQPEDQMELTNFLELNSEYGTYYLRMARRVEGRTETFLVKEMSTE